MYIRYNVFSLVCKTVDYVFIFFWFSIYRVLFCDIYFLKPSLVINATKLVKVCYILLLFRSWLYVICNACSQSQVIQNPLNVFDRHTY